MPTPSHGPTAPATPVVYSDFAGANIIVDAIAGDEVTLHQDLRDTEGWWFYWCFGVRHAAGRTLRFRFTNQSVLAALGPAVSPDAGRTWDWLGAEAVSGDSFTYAFGPEVHDARFCLAMPYTQRDLEAFTARHTAGPSLEVSSLCTTRRGRSAELVRAGQLNGDPAQRVLLTCRHHACEMMASYSLEGLLDYVLGDDPEGCWLREHVEFLVVPFADKDGVEDGDQGKNRRPRDHNRDYAGDSVHPETRALRELVPGWSAGRLRLALDLHCPWIRGHRNEDVYFVGTAQEVQWEAVERFSRLLEAARIGPIPFSPANNLPFGVDWNTGDSFHQGRCCADWAFELPGVTLAAGLEIPYASAGGTAVTPASARALGADLARAICRYLRGEAGYGQADSGTRAS